MPSPEESYLYYEQPLAQTRYSRKQTGKPNIGRLLRGEACWELPSQTRALKPKTLILADWTAACWSNTEVRQMIGLLREMFQKGFSIYVWHNNELKPISENNILSLAYNTYRKGINFPYSNAQFISADADNFLHFLLPHKSLSSQSESMPRGHYSDIFMQELSKKHLALGAVHVLEDHTLRQLAQKIRLSERNLLLDDLLRLCHPTLASVGMINISALFEQLKHSKMPPRKIIINKFYTMTAHQVKQLDLLKKTYPELVFEANYSKVVLSADQFSQLTTQGSVVIEQLGAFNLENMPAIRELQASGSFESDGLNKILIGASELEAVCLQNTGAHFFLNVPPGCLNKLKTIELSGKGIININLLLEAAPELISLKLSELRRSADELKHKLLAKLRVLSIENDTDIQSLLSVAPNIIDLNLNKCKFDTLRISPGYLNLLETMKISNSKISSIHLTQLIASAPKLETLELFNVLDFNERFSLNPGHHPKLLKLTLTHIALTPEILNQFLQASPALRYLDFSSIQGLDSECNFVFPELNKLEAIYIRKVQISAANLKKLLSSATILKALIITVDTIVPDDLHLEKLRSMDLIYSPQSENFIFDLKVFLTATPNLSRLVLDNRASVISQFNFCSVILNKLEIFQIKNGTFTSDKLTEISRACPNLKTLRLTQVTFSWRDTSDNPILDHLEELDLGGQELSLEQLKWFLRAAPHLKVLKVSIGTVDSELKSLLTRIPTCYIIRSQGQSIQPELAKLLQLAPLPIESELPEEEMEYQSQPIDSPFKVDDYQQAPVSRSFQYTPPEGLVDQTMIINQFSQYLTVTRQHESIIPQVQKGICRALVCCFRNTPLKQWDRMLQIIASWDGTEAKLNEELSTVFDRLYWYICHYQLETDQQPNLLDGHKKEKYDISATKEHFIGDRLSELLQTPNPYSLNNVWHTIFIKPLTRKKWVVYDPNFVTGWRKVSEDQLLATIHKCLGPIVSVSPSMDYPPPQIADPDLFIAGGGISMLNKCINKKQILALLPEGKEYTKTALDGLLLRDTDGVPAWIRGLDIKIHGKISKLIPELIRQFIAQNPGSYKEKLKKSLDTLSQIEKHFYIASIKCWDDVRWKKVKNQLVAILRTTPASQDQYEKMLSTWKKELPPIDSLLAWCQHCLTAKHRNLLIELKSGEEVSAVNQALQNYAKSTKRPVFYISSPDDLICLASWIEHQADGTGIIRKGPGGALHDFLNQNHGKKPVLLVNYDRFTTDDLVRFNTLVDRKRKADGTPVPEDALIIGFRNINKPDCYQGSDFNSRFHTEHCPVSATELTGSLPPPIPVKGEEDQDEGFISINLYHAPDWKEQLMGGWILQGRKLTFEQGKLAKALKKGHAIEIRNGHWDNEEFLEFWRRVPLPSNTRLRRFEGYDWTKMQAIAHCHLNLSSNALVLNPATFSNFFQRYQCKDNALFTLPGIIAEQANKRLAVNLTRELTEDEWAKIMDECGRYHVTLDIHIHPQTPIPNMLKREPMPHTKEPWNAGPGNATKIISSTDKAATASMIFKDNPQDWMVIDITECSPEDLFENIDARPQDGDPPSFIFKTKRSFLLNALNSGRKVIIKGAFSPELVDALTPMLLERYADTHAKGQLTLIQSTVNSFNKCFPVVNDNVSAAIRERLLDPCPESLKPFLEQESINRLIARRDFLVQFPETPSGECWKGLQSLDLKEFKLTPFNADTSEEECKAFTASQLENVLSRLRTKPMTFIAGVSGVGKSTFVERTLCQPGDVLYSGENSIESWAKDKTGSGRKYLFLDEGNLSPRNWSEFEGLYNTPPTLFINGVLYELSQEHKVIFSGNPLSYGDERKLALLFHQHGNTVVFSPLPTSVVYEKTLKPLFENTALKDKANEVSTYILRIYEFLVSCSTTDILITPRELQMMVLLIITHHNKHPRGSVEDVTAHISWQIASSLVPPAKQDEFAALFKPQNSMPQMPAPKLKEYKVTASRQQVKDQIDLYLALRASRQQSKGNEDQQYGGLGGLIIEGLPGVGKSELVIATLIAHGYHEIHDFNKPVTKAKAFYHIPVSMPLSEKKTVLLKAFDEGSLVLIDELNSSPFMEGLLNDLLMGKNPEDKKKRPKKPGFMMIATQNPANMDGRLYASNALSRRVTTVTLPEYTKEELGIVLKSKGLPEQEVKPLVEAYTSQVTHARLNHLKPEPTLRHLFKIVEQVKAAAAPKVKLKRRGSDLESTNKRYQQEKPSRPERSRKKRHAEDSPEAEKSQDGPAFFERKAEDKIEADVKKRKGEKLESANKRHLQEQPSRPERLGKKRNPKESAEVEKGCAGPAFFDRRQEGKKEPRAKHPRPAFCG